MDSSGRIVRFELNDSAQVKLEKLTSIAVQLGHQSATPETLQLMKRHIAHDPNETERYVHLWTERVVEMGATVETAEQMAVIARRQRQRKIVDLVLDRLVQLVHKQSEL